MSNDHAIQLNIQHQEPSVYYCYKFWLSTGEVDEGCTKVMTSKDLFLDPNEYGWVYMTIPIVGLFLMVLIFYILCGPSKKSTPAPPLEPEIVSEVAMPAYRQAAPPYQNPRGLYSVIPMDTFGSAQPTKPRIYPSLSSRKQSAKRPAIEKKVSKKPKEDEGLLKEKDGVDSSSSIEDLHQ